MSCHPCYVFDGIYPEHVSGYEDGTLYGAYYYGKDEYTCKVDGGPYTYGSDARRWAYCAGIDQYGNSADQLILPLNHGHSVKRHVVAQTRRG
jgi:hypothetical protein